MSGVLVTGAAGFLGQGLVERLVATGGNRAGDHRSRNHRIVAVDRRPLPEHLSREVEPVEMDIRDPGLAELLRQREIDRVVHLAAVVTPGPGMSREEQHSIDVGGTENVLHSCLASGVRRLVVTSSGAAYGYRADSPRWLTEDHPLAADRAFAYAWHKRLVEERLALARQEHPELEQVVLRLSTVLGCEIHNQITALFERKVLLGVRGGDDRFVFVWNGDVAACLEQALHSRATGVFNLAGDGALSMSELAAIMGKPYLRLPAPPLHLVLGIAHPLGLVPYGPEQVRFLQYRPVLANRRLRDVFGFRPCKTSREAFEAFWASRRGPKR